VYYNTIKQLHIFQNFIHDTDFNFLLKQSLYKTFEKQINQLEETINVYKIPLPRRPPKTIRTPNNTEALTDKFIATLIVTLLQENIDLQIRAIKSSVTNDNIRELFRKFLHSDLEVYDKAVKYVKIKGWIEEPPIYPQSPQGTQEKLNTGEAFHLWNHLSFRYDTVEVTQIYENYAHDLDFTILLSKGLKNTLEKQINILENEMDHFGLPLPERPPKSVRSFQKVEIMDDQVIYRRLLTGIQNMFDTHATSLKQTTTNDRLRSIYKKFLTQEIDIYNNFLKYGKLKGWLLPTPIYQT